MITTIRKKGSAIAQQIMQHGQLLSYLAKKHGATMTPPAIEKTHPKIHINSSPINRRGIKIINPINDKMALGFYKF